MSDDGVNSNDGGPDITFKGGTQCDSVLLMEQYRHAILSTKKKKRKENAIIWHDLLK